MPELPEVETVRRGLAPLIVGSTIEKVDIHEARLRYPIVPGTMKRLLTGKEVTAIRRRGKYLLIEVSESSTLLAHLGMTGRFQFCPKSTPRPAHLHATFILNRGKVLRYIDPRRFGMLEALKNRDLTNHRLLASLGPEPLSGQFDGEYLLGKSRKRKSPIKNFIMNANVVVGVGNIYASEALHLAGIHPHRGAGRLSGARIDQLVAAIKDVLGRAIAVGGTTLRDFRDPSEEAGYFAIELSVYGRESHPCKTCSTPIKRSIQGNRSTFYCPKCQH